MSQMPFSIDSIRLFDSNLRSLSLPDGLFYSAVHLMIIVPIYLQRIDCNILVSYKFGKEELVGSTLDELGEMIKESIKKSLPFLPQVMDMSTYQFYNIEEGHTIPMGGELLAEKVFLSGIHTLRFQAQTNCSLDASKKRTGKSQNMLADSLRTRRSAYLQPSHSILTMGKLNLQQTPVPKLSPQMVLMSSQLSCIQDHQIQIPICKMHKHQNIFGSIVKLQYFKDNARKMFEAHAKNVLLYAKESSPQQYCKATAQQIAIEFEKGDRLWIFDGYNNSFEVMDVEITEPKMHTFYSIESKEKQREAMLIVDDVRMLNTLLLDDVSQMVVLRDKLKPLIFYFFNEEINHQYEMYNIAVNRYIQRLDWKTEAGFIIYLNHNLPSLTVDRSVLHQEYEKWFDLSIDQEMIQQLSGQMDDGCVIYIKKRVVNTGGFKKDRKGFILRVKLDQYLLPSSQQQQQIILPQDTYYIITAKLAENIYQIISLYTPNPQADTHILWVDDHPIKSTLKQQIQDRAEGSTVSIARAISTRHAIAWLRTFYYYLRWVRPNMSFKMITDMERDRSPQAGADLIEQSLKQGFSLNIFLFVSTPKAIEILQRRKLLSPLVRVSSQQSDLLTWCSSPK